MEVDDEGNNNSDDEIVQEIDVYLSPELSSQLHLIQYPLQSASSSNSRGMTHRSEMTVQQPDVVMIKPQHAALQLEYAFPYHEGGGLGRKRIFESYQVPVVTHMALGRFDETGSTLQLVPLSNVIQMRPSMEHMRQSPDDNLDEFAPEIVTSQSTEGIHGGSAAAKLMFHRPESEKVATSRRSSYAYYQASKAAEPWIPLQVISEPTSSSHRNDNKFQHEHNGHSTSRKGTSSQTLSHNLDHDATASYVKSLNYIPHSTTCATPGDKVIPILLPSSEITIVEEFTVPSHDLTIFDDESPIAPLSLPPPTGSTNQERDIVPSSTTSTSLSSHSLSTPVHISSSTTTIRSKNHTSTSTPSWKKDLTTIVTNLLQGPGVPIPYLVIRSRFPMLSSNINDEDLLEALSSCALLVRGNFVLKSSLLPISNPLVMDARDFILWIMNKYKILHRDALVQVLCPDSKYTPYTMTTSTSTIPFNNKASTSNTVTSTINPLIITQDTISLDVIQGILSSIGRKTTMGVQLKVEDDTFVQTYYPQFASLHFRYWTRKEQHLSKWIQLYEEWIGRVKEKR